MKPQQSTTEQVAVVIKIIIFVCSAVFKMLFPPTDPSVLRAKERAEQSRIGLENMQKAIADVERYKATHPSPSVLIAVPVQPDVQSPQDTFIVSSSDTNYNPNRVNTMSPVACGQAQKIKNNPPQTVADCREFGIELNNGDEFGEGVN